ncbi:MAG: DUF4148 domain-containing protein, partial [Rhizobacter sp.]|nr:DUF4148 domain-containing protein [Rhizobacter sp.]
AIALAGAASATFAQEGTRDFPRPDTLSSRTRAEVLAEFLAARRAGTLELHNYAEASRAPQARSTLPRAQVAAEACEAQRLGTIGADEAGAHLPTPMQAAQIEAAGRRALDQSTASN